MKNFFETLAVLGTSAVLLTACGGAQVPANTSTDVPASVDVKPASDAAAAKTDAPKDAAAPAANAANAAGNAAATPAPSAPGAVASAAPSAASSAKPAAKPAAAKKSGKKKDANGSCGEGTCG
jgi:hypothetical protein